jgi:hypothetical protein
VESRLRADSALAARVRELRVWQAARFFQTYDDLRHDPRYGEAVQFFLDHVYGPQDFSRRDRELGRALTYLERVLPESALRALVSSIELDVLTVELDLSMAAQLPPGPVSAEIYVPAYQAVGKGDARARQLELLLGIVADLDRIARQDWIGLALSAAYWPAQLAGFGALQEFLQRGFEVFHRMRGTESLQQAIRERETKFIVATFSGALSA